MVSNVTGHPFVMYPSFSFCNSDGSTDSPKWAFEDKDLGSINVCKLLENATDTANEYCFNPIK
jgi:hypothetical protein